LEVPIKNDNIILTDGRNLDMLEEKALKKANITLINTESFNDKDIWKKSIDSFVDKVDVICVHIDEDILDIKHVPNHRTPEPNGPDIYTAIENIRYIMSTGKVAAYSLLSVYHGDKNPGNEISTLNGMRLLGSALESWREYPSLSNI
jgi:arginase family enzyme